jgi:hypothetical protein
MRRRKRIFQDELTTAMHSDFQITEEDDQKHAAWTALGVIESGVMSVEEACEEYGVSKQDLERHRNEWLRLKTQ